ncbi:MAG: hemolysin III family protein [Candidatus Promineifilaceae bacterium]|nr:hemolysin III family protein [Candidatus Promineifilaceae bacterium]
MATLEQLLHEPLSALLHLLGALFALPGLALLLAMSRHDAGRLISLMVYGFSLVSLYGASTLLHGLKVPPRLHNWLNRLDHMAIFFLIAGTYTPIVYNLFPSRWRWPVLVAVWGIAFVGMAYKLTSMRIHGFFNVSVYMILGWGALPLALALRLLPIISPAGLGLLLLGGLIYSAGFVIYYLEWPDPWPNVFGHHEIWHLFVLGGSLCHYLFMLLFVAPANPLL